VTDWSEHAACAGVDVALFFPEEGENPTQALAVCAACPVRDHCLREALERDERHGVWGGLTPRQRHRLRYGQRLSLRERPWQRAQRQALQAHGIAADARAHGLDPVQAVATRMVLSWEEAHDLLERSLLGR